MGGPITVELLKCCDWSLHKFIGANFSKLTDSSQIFRLLSEKKNSRHVVTGVTSTRIVKNNFDMNVHIYGIIYVCNTK